MDFILFDNEKYKSYYSSYHMTEDRGQRKFNDLLEFHIIELPKIPEDSMGELENGELFKWVKFLNSKSKEEMEMLSQQNSGIKEAYMELTSLENDEERRAIYEAREKDIMDYKVQQRAARQEGLQEGIKEGIKKEKTENAKKMLTKGMSIELIEEITGLSKEEILKLKEDADY